MPPRSKKTRTLRKTQKRGVSFRFASFGPGLGKDCPRVEVRRSFHSRILKGPRSRCPFAVTVAGPNKRNESSRRWFEKRTETSREGGKVWELPRRFGKINEYVCKRDAKRWMFFFVGFRINVFQFFLGQWQLMLDFAFNYLPNVLLDYECLVHYWSMFTVVWETFGWTGDVLLKYHWCF